MNETRTRRPPAAAVAVLALWLPFVWVVLDHQRAWYLERLYLLPGLMPAVHFGNKSSDRLVASLITLALVGALTALAASGPRARRAAWILGLVCGAVASFGLFGASKM